MANPAMIGTGKRGHVQSGGGIIVPVRRQARCAPQFFARRRLLERSGAASGGSTVIGPGVNKSDFLIDCANERPATNNTSSEAYRANCGPFFHFAAGKAACMLLVFFGHSCKSRVLSPCLFPPLGRPFQVDDSGGARCVSPASWVDRRPMADRATKTSRRLAAAGDYQLRAGKSINHQALLRASWAARVQPRVSSQRREAHAREIGHTNWKSRRDSARDAEPQMGRIVCANYERSAAQ